MADPRREFRVGCYIVSRDRIPRQVEERAAEEWEYDLQNHIRISRGSAQRIDDWGIPFPTIIPTSYPPTLRPPTEPARYIRTRPTIAVMPGLHSSCETRCESCDDPTKPNHSDPNQTKLSVPIARHQLPPTFQPPLQPPIHRQAPPVLTNFHPAPHNIDPAGNLTPQPPANSSTSTAASAR